MNNNDNTYKPYEVIISLSALSMLGLLLAVTKLYLSPFIVFLIILIVLYPFKKNKAVKYTLIGIIVLFVIWILHSISQILIPFLIAFMLSYILNPIVEKLTQKNISRTISSLLIILIFLAIITTVIIFLAPLIVNQFTELITSLPYALYSLDSWIKQVLLPKLMSLGIPTEDLQNKIIKELPSKLEQILNSLLSSLSGIFAGLSVILTQLVNLILIPFLTFYILKDFNELKAFVKKLLPVNKKESIIYYYHKIDDLLGSFLRGSIVCALIHGVVVYIFLSILGIKYPIFLSALAVILNLIPYFGLLVEITLAVIVAIFSGNPGFQIPLVVLIYLLQNLLETSFVVPKIVGEKIGLHPAMLILSLFVFSYFFGFIGLLIALPSVSIILMFLKEWMSQKESSIQN